MIELVLVICLRLDPTACEHVMPSAEPFRTVAGCNAAGLQYAAQVDEAYVLREILCEDAQVAFRPAALPT